MSEEPKYTKTILCLANSRKMSGRCLAGKEIDGDKVGGWVRPISSREHEEISEEERRYENGNSASLLDIISIPFLGPKPGTYQSENHLIADKYYWERTASATWAQIVNAVDNVAGPLWINGHSTYNGGNDQIPEEEAAALTNSLLLVKPTKLSVVVAPEGGVFGPVKRRVRARFSLNGANYNLSLTDGMLEQKYLKGQDGVFPVDNALLCVSLGEPFKGNAYKLAAALITPDRVGQTDE